MKTLRSLLVLTALPALASAALACECSVGKPAAIATTTTTADTAKKTAGHPLKGVVIDILADRSALLVQHEEIPGVMKAMTMLLKVDADTLKSAQKGQAITATLVRKDDGWWLENVTPVAAD